MAARPLPPGIPKDIAIALVVLPRIKQLIVPALKGRARSFGTNKLCAQAVVEAWRCMHGEVEVRSEQAYLACQAYWKACGGKEIGKTNDILNWRRRVKLPRPSITPWLRLCLQRCTKPPDDLLGFVPGFRPRVRHADPKITT